MVGPPAAATEAVRIRLKDAPDFRRRAHFLETKMPDRRGRFRPRRACRLERPAADNPTFSALETSVRQPPPGMPEQPPRAIRWSGGVESWERDLIFFPPLISRHDLAVGERGF
jgi:hypothetical protein